MTLDEIYTSAFTLTKKEQKALSRKIVKEYQTAYNSIKNELKSMYAGLSEVSKDQYFVYMSKYDRLSKQLGSIGTEYLKAARSAGFLQYASAKLSISNIFVRQTYAIDWVSKQASFTMLNPAYVQASVYGSLDAWNALASAKKAALIKKYGSIEGYLPQSGTLIGATMAGHRTKDLQKIKSAVTQALITGKSYTQTAKDIKKILNTSTSNAMRIATTEGHRNLMAGNFAMMNDSRASNPEVGAKRMIAAVLDSSTRPQSAGMDGQIEDENGQFTYPNGAKVSIPGNSGEAKYDINDREGVVLTINGEPPLIRRGRVPGEKGERGENEIISWKSFSDWAKENGIKKNKYGVMYT